MKKSKQATSNAPSVDVIFPGGSTLHSEYGEVNVSKQGSKIIVSVPMVGLCEVLAEFYAQTAEMMGRKK